MIMDNESTKMGRLQGTLVLFGLLAAIMLLFTFNSINNYQRSMSKSQQKRR